MANEIKTLLDSLDGVRRDWVEDWKEDVNVDWDPEDLEGDDEPANSAVPTITGTAKVGETLTAAAGTWTGDATITYTYQWMKKSASDSAYKRIVGANSSTYVVQADDVDHTIIVKVNATNLGGSATAQSVATSSVTAS